MATITTSLQEVLNRLSSVETTLREEHAKLRKEVCSKVDICEGNVLELQKTVEKLEKEVKIQGNLFEMRESYEGTILSLSGWMKLQVIRGRP